MTTEWKEGEEALRFAQSTSHTVTLIFSCPSLSRAPCRNNIDGRNHYYYYFFLFAIHCSYVQYTGTGIQ